MSKIVSAFNFNTKDLRVAIIGETIIDVFQTVELRGESAKSSCPAFELVGDPEYQLGGAGAVARHLVDFCDDVTLYSNSIDPKYEFNIINDIEGLTLYPISEGTIETLRFIDKYRNKTHFEIKTFSGDTNRTFRDGQNQDIAEKLSEADIILVADFGHGLFDGVPPLPKDVYLMVQTNSSNYGFNLATKWNRQSARAVFLDREEASLVLGRRIKRFDGNRYLLQQLRAELTNRDIFVTQHSHGSCFFGGDKITTYLGLATEIIDTIGAGDTFFAFGSLCHYLNMNDEDLLQIPSLAAAITTRWRGNEQAVTEKALLTRALAHDLSPEVI